MNEDYGRNLDLNLLRVFLVIADSGSVTSAAARLYLTQPAVSAALRRLTEAIGAPLFARRGRGLVLTSRGTRLLTVLRPNLTALIDAALSPPAFDPLTSDRTLRLGVADSIEEWLVPALLRVFEKEAPRMRLIVLPVQFRTVGAAIAENRVDAAVTVADEMRPSVRRMPLFSGGFVCLFDPRHARVKKALTEATYFAHDHVIVSYNGDLRGVVEDAYDKSRNVRCSVASFDNVGAIVDGSPLLATLPDVVAHRIRALRPHLRTATLPFPVLAGPTATELLWPSALEDDPACAFFRAAIVAIAKSTLRGRPRPARRAASRGG